MTDPSRGFAGFVLSLTPMACQLLGWKGSGGGAPATVYYVSHPSMPTFRVASRAKRQSKGCSVLFRRSSTRPGVDHGVFPRTYLPNHRVWHLWCVCLSVV